MGGVATRSGGSTISSNETTPDKTARSDANPGKHTSVGATAQEPPAQVVTYDDMERVVRAAEALTERASHGDRHARQQVLVLLAPVEARLSQINDHRGGLAQFGAGNIAGQRALDMSESAIRLWRQRIELGTHVRAGELVLSFRAGAEPIRFLTGEARDAPTLRGFNQASRAVGAGATAPLLAPAALALVAEEAPILAFLVRTSASRVALWAATNPAAALAASELLLNYGVQIGESGWSGFWSQLDDPTGRWLFLMQILVDYVHVETSLHAAPARANTAAAPESPPDLAGARNRLSSATILLAHIDEEASYTSANISDGQSDGAPGGARRTGTPSQAKNSSSKEAASLKPKFGKWAPDNPFPHVRQRDDDWCGAACGEMSAGRLGVDLDQEDLVATRHYSPERKIGKGQRKIGGGFYSRGLQQALEEVGPVPGRQWKGGEIPQDVSTPAGLLKHIKGYLSQTKASVVLGVDRGNHWIVIDSVTPEGLFVIRDPGDRASALITPEQLHAWYPSGEAVFSFPEPTP